MGHFFFRKDDKIFTDQYIRRKNKQKKIQEYKRGHPGTAREQLLIWDKF